MPSSKLDPAHRCPHYPRNLPAEAIEDQVWEAIYRLLTDPDRLRQAAQRSITAATQPNRSNATSGPHSPDASTNWTSRNPG